MSIEQEYRDYLHRQTKYVSYKNFPNYHFITGKLFPEKSLEHWTKGFKTALNLITLYFEEHPNDDPNTLDIKNWLKSKNLKGSDAIVVKHLTDKRIHHLLKFYNHIITDQDYYIPYNGDFIIVSYEDITFNLDSITIRSFGEDVICIWEGLTDPNWKSLNFQMTQNFFIHFEYNIYGGLDFMLSALTTINYNNDLRDTLKDYVRIENKKGRSAYYVGYDKPIPTKPFNTHFSIQEPAILRRKRLKKLIQARLGIDI